MIPLARAAVAAAALLLASGADPARAQGASGLDGTAWVLIALPGHPAPTGSDMPWARFEGGAIAGRDGCNFFSVGYSATGSVLRIGPPGPMTMMACADDVMKRGGAFRDAFARAAAYRIAEGRLQLLAADGAVLATLAAQRDELAGTAWRVTAVNNGRQAVVGVLAGSELTMDFAADGTLSGSAGCNRFTARYGQSLARLAIGTIAATRRACDAPAGVMEQEDAFLRALATVATARVEGERVELRTEGGELAVSLGK